MGHRSRGHEVGPAYQGLGLDQQVLGYLDAVLRGVFLVESGEPLPDVLRDVDAGDLMMQELRLTGASQRHETQQELDLHTLYLFECVLQSLDLEHWLRPEGVRSTPRSARSVPKAPSPTSTRPSSFCLTSSSFSLVSNNNKPL